MTDTKHCSKCDTDKPLSAFTKNAKSADGKCRYCRDCMNAYIKAHYDRNRDSILKHKSVFFQENKGRIKAQHRIYKIFCKARTSSKRLEALTGEDFAMMSDEQRKEIAGRLKGVLALVDSAGGEV